MKSFHRHERLGFSVSSVWEGQLQKEKPDNVKPAFFRGCAQDVSPPSPLPWEKCLLPPLPRDGWRGAAHQLGSPGFTSTQAGKEHRVRNIHGGTEGAPRSGSLFSLLHVARLDCSTTALTHAGRTRVSPASAGVCSALQALPPGQNQGCRSSNSSETIFPCVLPLLPMITNTYMTSAAADGHGANPTAPPTTARAFRCRRSRGRSRGAVPRPPAVCATDAPCLLLRRTVIQHDSVSSRATATERGCNENRHV